MGPRTKRSPRQPLPPLENAAFEEFRQARPDLVDEIREAVGIARDRLAIAAPELDLDTAMGGAGYREEAGAWQLDAADFTNACGRDAVKGDLVYFSVGADALPGSGGEVREVRVIAELVTRSAKRSEFDDLCTLETRWRSDGGARRADNGDARHPRRGRLHARGPAPGGRRRGGAELDGRRAGMGARGGAAKPVRGDPPAAPREQEHEDVTGGGSMEIWQIDRSGKRIYRLTPQEADALRAYKRGEADAAQRLLCLPLLDSARSDKLWFECGCRQEGSQYPDFHGRRYRNGEYGCC